MALTLNYAPARDPLGEVIGGEVTLSIDWKITEPGRLGWEPKSLTTLSTYNADNSLRDCYDLLNGKRQEHSRICDRDVAAQGGLRRDEDPAGSYMIVSEQYEHYSGVPDAPHFSFDGYEIVSVRTLENRVTETGDSVDCHSRKAGEEVPWELSPCSDHARWVIARDAQGRPREMDVVMTITTATKELQPAKEHIPGGI